MGFNAHFANLVAGLYLATGQDPAHVVEGSVGITTAEIVEGGMYFSVTLPNILLGVVGGGTGLPHQKRSLAMMRITKFDKESKFRLARNLAYVVMAGELSLLASLASRSLASAHAKYGRNKSLETRA
jgi:hydroxymethylglutaryl-CoA reductase (NADPH)